jgi:hypothetical protein
LIRRLVEAMSIVRVGSTQKFSQGWDSIFGGKKAGEAEKKSAAKRKKAPVKAKGRKKK